MSINSNERNGRKTNRIGNIGIIAIIGIAMAIIIGICGIIIIGNQAMAAHNGSTSVLYASASDAVQVDDRLHAPAASHGYAVHTAGVEVSCDFPGHDAADAHVNAVHASRAAVDVCHVPHRASGPAVHHGAVVRGASVSHDVGTADRVVVSPPVAGAYVDTAFVAVRELVEGYAHVVGGPRDVKDHLGVCADVA